MASDDLWTRRQFVNATTALIAVSSIKSSLGQPPPVSQANSAEVTAGGLVPLLESNLTRPLRYTPERGALVIRNGREFFNRPLYGPNIPFRVDGGDLPEFSLYLPGHGGNLRLGLATKDGARWLSAAEHVTARYFEGRLLYEVRDALLGDRGLLRVEALTQGAGLWLEISSEDLRDGVSLLWAFAGVSGRKGKRNGDIGCEVEPIASFFQVRPEECRGNLWTVRDHEAEVVSGGIRLHLTAPPGAELRVVDGGKWDEGWAAIWASRETVTSPALPALAGRFGLGHDAVRLHIRVLQGALLPAPPAETGLTEAENFAQRQSQLAAVAGAVRWITPDPFLDGMAGPLGIAADAVWDEAQGCVMHGAVAWRTPLAGWRGPYALDALGRHDRMQRHLRHWIARQNLSEVANGSGGLADAAGFAAVVEATGKPDKGSAASRSEGLLHSNGDLSHNHYDMNLVFFDALLRHLRWTGDVGFAREAWPALMRHAAWERRLFRRDFGSPGSPQPLYEAYAAIWASDNLQYNGGGTAHASAYNIFLNRGMAELAEILGEDPVVAQAYRAEAQAIAAAMRSLLWMPARGAFAESKDWLAPRTLAESPAVWTVYHTVDSEVASRKEAWLMATDRLRAIRKVPVVGAGVPAGGWQMACSDWMPYEWSLTLLVLGENLHMALALFQAGMPEQGYALLHGSLTDAGYRGLCPGNLPMSLQLDPHRQESQRDFADPIGCALRTLVEGLWGVRPHLFAGHLNLRPQLPDAWEHGEFHHPELTLVYVREGRRETWQIASKLAKPVALRLELRARTAELPRVRVNGQPVAAAFDPESVGWPSLRIEAAPAASWRVAIEWHGERPLSPPVEAISCREGDEVVWPAGVQAARLDDPQGCLRGGAAKSPGSYTVFARMEQGACRYWLPLALQVAAKQVAAPASTLPQPGERFETVSLEGLLTGQVREIFTRGEAQPRPDLCSLNLPDSLLGGWANFDVKATVDDAGLRAAGGSLQAGKGLVFETPADPRTPNCCYLSHWTGDRQRLTLGIGGRAQAVYLLLACTTFPQATRSLHGAVSVRYADGGAATVLELRSPANWWPIEQDYLVDDYVFRLEPIGAGEQPLPMRIDLQTGKVRVLERATSKGQGRRIAGGSATVLRVAVEGNRELKEIELECRRHGVVMGVLGVTLGR